MTERRSRSRVRIGEQLELLPIDLAASDERPLQRRTACSGRAFIGASFAVSASATGGAC